MLKEELGYDQSVVSAIICLIPDMYCIAGPESNEKKTQSTLCMWNGHLVFDLAVNEKGAHSGKDFCDPPDSWHETQSRC